ncbi:DOMON domain-containing protein [Candidatus Fermentibacteria bacterium]|nr:DOMON domain-containing protein [Candidatus Fermentibacteria bacterium]
MKTAILALLALLAVQAGAQGWQEQEVSGFTLRWATTGSNALSVELTGPTTGWVAAGFDPDSMMLGANIIIGYYAGGTFIRDDYGWQLTSHRDDILLGGTSDVEIDGGGEAGGETEIRFTIPLDSGDQYDKPLEAGQTYTVLLAHGPDGADNFTTQHEFVTMTQIVVWGLGLESTTWGAVKESME